MSASEQILINGIVERLDILLKGMQNHKEAIEKLRSDLSSIRGTIQGIVDSLIEFYPPMRTILRYHLEGDSSGYRYRGLIEDKETE